MTITESDLEWLRQAAHDCLNAAFNVLLDRVRARQPKEHNEQLELDTAMDALLGPKP